MTYGNTLIIYGITLIILSILAVPSLILSRKPDAKEILDKIAPYQGWIGLVFCVWGLIGVIRAILHLSLIKYWFIGWLTWIAIAAMMAVLGFILGYATISKLILSNNEEAKKKGEEILAKLLPIQGKLGLIGLAVGVWAILFDLLY